MPPLPTYATSDVLKLRVAAQLAPLRWQRGLERLCVNLEAGKSWEESVDQLRTERPALAAIVAAGLGAGHPADITLEILRERAIGRASWQQLISALLYPVLLLLIALVVGSLIGMAMMSIVNKEFSDDERILGMARDFYDASLGGVLAAAWLTLLTGTVILVATPGARLKLLGDVPIFGRPYRWLGLSEILVRLSVFSRYQPSLTQALEATAQSFGSSALAPIARYVSQRIAAGEALPNALHSTIVSDSRAGIALTLIESDSITPSTLRASRLLDEMILHTCARLQTILPLFVLLIIAGLVWGAWSSYFAIMQTMTAYLSTWIW